MTTKALTLGLTIRALGDSPSIVITTPTQDLMHDTIDPLGMDTTRYMSGTRAVNFAHDHSRLPVAKTLGLSRSPAGIRANFEWLDHAHAGEVRRVFEAGVLGASVEFVPVDMTPNASGGFHFSKCILTGWALTGNPANPECVRMLKSLQLSSESIFVDPDDFRSALDASLGRAIARECAGAARRALGGEQEYVALADAGRPASGTAMVEVNEDLARLVGSTIADVVGREVRRALDAARGRID